MKRTLSFLVVLLVAISAYGLGLPSDNAAAQLFAAQYQQQRSSSMPIQDAVMDNSIDPDAYIIGGGDVFSAYAIGLPSISYSISVDNNGNAYIPELGLIPLNRVTLKQAQETIKKFISDKLKTKNDIYVTLGKPKKVTISVTGFVAQPGTYILPGTCRILDALKAANDGILPALDSANYREVVCKNLTTTTTYDLYQFLYRQDMLQNPYIYPGDNITISFATNVVLVTGTIFKYYKNLFTPIKKGEDLADFLSLFVLDPACDSENVIIQRLRDDFTPITTTYSLKNPQPFPIYDQDIISLTDKKNYPRPIIIQVNGEVVRPGMYPAADNITTARELIDKAGGPTPYAQIERAVIIRRASMKGNIPSGKESTIRPETNAGLFAAQISNDYAVISLKSNPDVVIATGDNIIVPKIDRFVYISGRVKYPGAYPVVTGKKYGYYVSLAGGYARGADKTNTVVVAKYSDITQIRQPGIMQDGDILVVPTSEEMKATTKIFIPILTAVSAVVTTILAVWSVTK